MSFVRHVPAFTGQISSLFNLKPGDLFLDLTLGDGGHTVEALQAGARVISLDVDQDAINRSIGFLSPEFTPVVIQPELNISIPNDFQWLIIHSNFRDIGDLKKNLALPQFNGIIADLGTSQFQLATPERGFSFNLDGPLDMRLDSGLGVTAADLVNALTAPELEQLLLMVDEYQAKTISRAIVSSRKRKLITTTIELAAIVARVKKTKNIKINPATKTFMALRMAVNLERESIQSMLLSVPDLLIPNGIFGAISFHSGEDRLVKHFLKKMFKQGLLRVINVKPLKPTLNEIQTNPKVRSAQLRLARKI